MTGFAVPFRYLKPQVQERLLEELDIKGQGDANWHDLPIALIIHTSNPELPEHTWIP